MRRLVILAFLFAFGVTELIAQTPVQVSQPVFTPYTPTEQKKKAKKHKKNGLLRAVANSALNLAVNVAESKVSNALNSNSGTSNSATSSNNINPTSGNYGVSPAQNINPTSGNYGVPSTNNINPTSGNYGTPVASSTSVQNWTTPVQQLSTPVQNWTTPVKQLSTQVELSTPVTNAFTPVKQMSTLVELSTPVKDAFIPVNNPFTPVKQMSNPVELSTPVNNVFEPIKQLSTPVVDGFKPVRQLSIPPANLTIPEKKVATLVEISKSINNLSISQQLNESVESKVSTKPLDTGIKKTTNSKEEIVSVDLTQEFDKITLETKNRFEELKAKWPFTKEMFDRDMKNLLSYNKPVDLLVTLYYQNLETWRQVETWISFLSGYFRTGGPGDIKNGILGMYNKPNIKVTYKDKLYTIDGLGNVNYGIALKAGGFSLSIAQCTAGLYQMYSSVLVKPNSENNIKFLKAVYKANKDGAFQGKCFDHFDDSRMIAIGYNWY